MDLMMFDTNETDSQNNTITEAPQQMETDINNEILNLLLPSSSTDEVRPDTFVEDKIQPDSLKVMEMQFVTDDPLDSNTIDEHQPADHHPPYKMAVHVGEDAANFLAKLHPPSNISTDDEPSSTVDLSKMRPTFKWKIGLWTRCSVKCDGGTRVRDVSCYETTTSTLVDDALCTEDKPEDVESCNEVLDGSSSCHDFVTHQEIL